jgi:hypothetical protein
MVISAGSIVWLLTADRFTLAPDQPQLVGLNYTDPAVVRAAIGIVPGSAPNLFMLRTAQMERELLKLPAVAAAHVEADLDGRMIVRVTERTPVVVLQAIDGQYLVDAEGVVLDKLTAGQLPAGLPVVDDQRHATAPAMAVGGRLDLVDLAAILQLGAVTPTTVGSGAASLALTIDDQDGFALTAAPFGWRAIFGQYTLNLRPPDLIARQVQCLRSLLGTGESKIDTIYLSPLEDRCGTFVPRTTPSPAPSA